MDGDVWRRNRRGLEFDSDANGCADAETGRHWSIRAEDVTGAAEGETLPPVDQPDTFRLAWAAFTPETDIER